ncbi:acetylxylan esterase AxeA1 [Segatella copri]|uniref:acetylxylan esterase AxeA1 n=1 Tax=Segatella copri TaxID=165179 RepID=UPI001C459529|nr:acetylxylan esterase AxeA1 [Segatella copri]MBW0050229.1 alpha/beta hydrolase fold domain-containing protein [Segatella copri]
MKKMVISSVLMLCSLSALAQSTARKFVLKNSADGQSELTCYLPQNPTGRAVVDCPGGGYSHLAMDHEGHQWAEYFNRQGIAFFVLKYRMPKGDRNIPLSDAYQAMRTVRDSAAVWHINKEDVGIMGFSAGGHLASSVSTHAEYDARPNFSILFYPVISMDERITHQGSCINFLGEERKTNPQLVKEWSNDKAVRRHLTPRAIILMSSDDEVVPPVTNGVAYYSAMRNEGNECTMHVYPTCGHGWGFSPGIPFHEQMLNDLTSWLNHFQGPKEDAVRVACIGNSITDGFGIGMAPVKGYPAVLQKKLGDGYQVKNFGVSARTMMNKGDLPYMNELAWRDAQAFNPNIVIIKLGTNDSKTHNWAHGADEYRQSMQAMIDTLKALPSKPKIYLCSPIPAFKDSWTISDSVIVNGEMPIIKKLAKKNKCQFIDLHTSYTYGDMMLKDGIHPNAKGAAKMADIIFDAIEKK